MGKFEYPLDQLNAIFTGLSVAFLAIDLLLVQSINVDMKWSCFSKRTFGFYEYEEGMGTDNTEDIDSQIETSDEDMS